ncbi:unnamed protein product [Rotaria sp. Silwood2]|nr:unnamed protein product [Rotaria sp. Silwood2]CAF2914850.1 unnamed protein product [Rotaria sp. Silwood2]CAF3256950.1 unnamed protein product [Rotaria sp. Silwood2]CAF3280170.1 unnamed protein product [Rotaria sp. Silwood2]CAF4229354.1 unnamed protein product [Rotaria sp. Silwood2]
MFNIDNIIQCATSISSLSSSISSSTSLYHPHSTRQNQTSSEFHIPSFASPLYNTPIPPQQQYHHSYPYQSYSQTLSQDEWALIVSLRMVNNLSVSPPYSAVHQQSGDVTSHQPSSSDQTGHQIPLSTYYATKATSIHPYTLPTPQHLLYAQQTQFPTTQTQQLLATAAPQPSTISAHTEPEQISLSSQISSSRQMSLPPQIQSGHQNHSPMLQLQSHSPPASPLPAIISPVQQHQRKVPDQSISASPQRHQSTYPQTPTIFHYNPTITGPTVQLLDPTKPYELEDTIKIG